MLDTLSPLRPAAPPPRRPGLLAGLSPRDQAILALACRKLGGSRADFAEALRALKEAVEESIPAGRLFLLGTADEGPVVGSFLSGVGLVEGAGGVRVARLRQGSALEIFGRFAP